MGDAVAEEEVGCSRTRKKCCPSEEDRLPYTASDTLMRYSVLHSLENLL